MNNHTPSYRGYRFPPEIISHAVWLYHRFCLSFRDVEDLPAERFFRKLLKGQGGVPRWMVTDKLRSYAAAHRTIMPSVAHDTSQYANNRAEVSHEPTRQRERGMRRFKSMAQAQRFLSVHGITQNLFRVGRHLLRAANYRILRARAFVAWNAVTCA
jgi:putative transposase